MAGGVTVARRTYRRIPDYFLYGEAPRPHGGRTLHVEPIEARSARHHWKIDPHRHGSLHQLIFVRHGRGVAFAESGVTHFSPPSLMLVPAGSVHGFEFEPGTLGHVVTIADELLQDLVRREPELAALFRNPLTLQLADHAASGARLLRAARHLAGEFATTAAGRTLALEGALAILLAQVLRVWRTEATIVDTPLGQHRELVARFRVLIEAGFRVNRPIPDYARELRVSESRLRNACLRAAGASPIQLLHARQMLEAKRQLFYTDRPVSEIAWDMGFEDAAYFTRFFTRRAGLSPRSFRARSLAA